MTTKPQGDLPPGGLVRSLLKIRGIAKLRDVPLHEMFSHFSSSGHLIIILFLALPFALPIPIPGLSVPFGMLIAVTGLMLLVGRPPWVPGRLGRATPPRSILVPVLKRSAGLSRQIEKLVRPRFVALTSPLFQIMSTLLIVICGVLLALPLPPGTNFLPGFTIVLLALGTLRRDGLCIMAGLLAFILNGVLFHSLYVLGHAILADYFL